MKWISVKDRLPEKDTWVAVILDSNQIFIAKYPHIKNYEKFGHSFEADSFRNWQFSHNVCCCNDLLSERIIYWCEIPDLPEEFLSGDYLKTDGSIKDS